MSARIINVLDAMPGAGKTEYFVEHAARLITSGKKDRVLVYAAPTTFLLEEVIARILKKIHVPYSEKVFAGRFNLEFENGCTVFRAYGNGKDRVDVSALVSSLFGVPTKDLGIASAPKGSIILITHEGLLRLPKTSPHYPPSAELVENAEERYAKVLREYITRVEKHKTLSVNWKPILHHCTLFFDEARSCILKNCMLELDRYQIGQLVSSSTISWKNALPKYVTPIHVLLHIKNRAYTDTGIEEQEIPQLVEMALDSTLTSDATLPNFVPPVSDLHNADEFFASKMRYYESTEEAKLNTYYLTPVGCSGVKEYARVHGYVSHTSLPPSIKNFFTLWKSMGENGRAEFILAGKFDVVFLDRDNEDVNKERKYLYHLLINPHSLFESFGNTVIMSAFFKDSQMYHMLKRDAYSFKYLLEKETQSGALQNIKERDGLIRKKLEDKLHFAFLIKPNPKSPYKHNVLSAAILNLKMLFPAAITQKLERTVAQYAKNNPNRRLWDFQILWDIFEGGRVYGDLLSPQALEATKPYAIPPLLQLARTAFDIAKDWAKSNNVTTINNLRNKTEGPKKLMLCMTNSVDSFSPEVKKSASDHSNAKTSPFDNVQPLMMLHDSRTSIRDRSNSKSREQLQREERYAEHLDWCSNVATKYIELPVQTRLHGLNEYTPYSVFAHLASLNLPPPLARMLHAILPKYDGHQDNVIENLVQTMYRTQLRSLKPEHSDNVLLIVAFRNSAVLLCQKLGYNEKYIESFLNDRTFAQSDLSIPYFDLGKEARIKAAARVGKDNRKYKLDGQSSLVNLFKTQYSVYKRRYASTQSGKDYFDSTLAPIFKEAVSQSTEAKTQEDLSNVKTSFQLQIQRLVSIRRSPKQNSLHVTNLMALKRMTGKRSCKTPEGKELFENKLLPIFEKGIAAAKKATTEEQLQHITLKVKQLLKKARSA